METKRKKTLFNVIMVVLILIIAGCGIMAVGNLKGWFGKDENSVLVSQNVKGVVNIQRSGVGYGLEKNVSLRDGDILETKNGTTADLSAGEENILSLNANTELEAVSVKKGDVQVSLDQGELFTDLASGNEKILFTFGKNSFTTGSGVFAISQQTGSASLDVFKDEIDLSAADGSSYTVKAGESVQITGDENDKWTVSTGKIAATSLNEYMIGKLTGCKDKDALCFTTDELQKVLDDRAAEKKAALEKSLSSSSKIPKTEDSSRKKGSSTAKAAATVTPAAEDNATVTTSGGEGSADQSTDGNDEYQSGDQDADQDGDFDAEDGSTEDGSAGDTSNNNDASGNDDNTDGDNAEDDTSDSKTCNITILCDTILNNMDNLTAGKEAYVPSNGVILDTSTVEFTEGETVFDVLKRVCEYTGIQLEYSWTPMYDSYYIEGINNLYEFDCGNESGWMYKVNGWFPNYGCSKYMLEDGDTSVWCYTCNGLGADVGDVWNG